MSTPQLFIWPNHQMCTCHRFISRLAKLCGCQIMCFFTLFELLAVEISIHLGYPALPHQPKRRRIRPRPRKILHSIFRLHTHQQCPNGIQHINSKPSPRNSIPIRRHLESITHSILRQVHTPVIPNIRLIPYHIIRIKSSFYLLH